MDREELLSTLKKLDEEVFAEFQDEVEEQRFTLSLIPTVNAESPFAAYLEGSILANVSTDYHGISRTGRFERMAVERALKCFHAEHAIVRLDSISAASRVVFKALLKSGNPVLSFNGRKQELCHGLSYRFAIFGADWENHDINWQELDEQIARHQPKIVIFSPTSFPFAIDTKRLAKAAHDAGALLWVDIGQNIGLVAAGLMPSPVDDADVVTFPTNDSLQGPEGAIILCKKELAETIERSVIDNGHSALHKNRLAALAVALRDAAAHGNHTLARRRRRQAFAGIALTVQASIGGFAHAACHEDNNIGMLGIERHEATIRIEQTAHALGVVLIHLAAKGADKVGFTGKNIAYGTLVHVHKS